MALYNHLYARKHGGKWMLRIEDTDAARTVPGSVEGIRYALEWAGLEYDYGPGRDGPQAPYFQSERLDLYRSYARKLLESNHAYRCFCTPDRLAETREKLARTGSNATYDKSCLHLTHEEVARRVKAGQRSIIRLNDSNLPTRPPSTDLIFGQLRDAHASLQTDPVLLKTDLFPTYHLASIVDDHEMGVTHVLRGEEWLPSLPLHLDLYAALKLTPPKFAHIPLLVNPDGSKMSKRNGDVQVIDYIRRGWEPEAILNWLALAGWGARHPEREETAAAFAHHDAPDSTAIMSPQELIKEFDLSAMTHRSSSLDPAKLEYINKRHLMRTWSRPEGLENLAEKVHDEIKERFPTSQYTSVEHIKDGILLLEGRLTNICDIPIHAPWLFVEPDMKTQEARSMLKKISAPQLKQVITDIRGKLSQVPEPWRDFDFSDLLHREQDRLGYGPKVFMKTLRHALTGMKDGPSVAEVIRVLGRERTIARLVVPPHGEPEGAKL
ncbi:glutamyl-tRNA synthetase [Macrolepiota fuliginosa MF-IS2]|uniref:Glutamyl-tRNA synthetase n=1 Tax=Macrolepiota fuliginosa MF-IS2 TaxID=1400762 RepID=A0A9P6BYM7_9AGAR|nr:glutamyl-tRNA synthetase [Macrolepiota fuliginosa MF-IS2]